MAKHRAKGDEQTRSNTTSGGKSVKATDEQADAKAGEGIAVYPPSPSDQAGEKTDNVPPAKRLPPDPPPGEGVDEATRLRAQVAALSAALSNLGINANEVANQAVKDMPEAQPRKSGPTRRAVVSMPGVEDTEVEYAADTPEEGRDAAAIQAFQARHGLWSMPQQPTVKHEAAARRGKKGGE